MLQMVQLGEFCLKFVNGKEHPVAYCSRTLTKCERNYSTTRKELLAVVHALQKFRCYLDQTFLLRTDHAALRWLWEFKDVFGQCARGFELMAELDFKLVRISLWICSWKC